MRPKNCNAASMFLTAIDTWSTWMSGREPLMGTDTSLLSQDSGRLSPHWRKFRKERGRQHQTHSGNFEDGTVTAGDVVDMSRQRGTERYQRQYSEVEQTHDPAIIRSTEGFGEHGSPGRKCPPARQAHHE